MSHVRSFPLRTKILVLCLSCTLLALGLQTWFFLASASSLLFKLEQEASQKSLGRMQDELYRWIKGYENALISTYNQGDLMASLALGVQDSATRLKNSRTAYTMMQTSFEPAQYVSALYLYSMDHKLISSSRIASTPRYNFPEDIFEDAVANRTKVVTDYAVSDNRVMLVTSVFNKSRQQPLLRLVLKLYANDVQTKVGFLVCDIDLKGFSRIVEKYVYADHQMVWLQPRDDNPLLVYGSQREAAWSEFTQISEALRSGNWKNPERTRVGNNVFLTTPQQKYDLTAYSLVPQAFLEESQSVLLRNLVLTALLLIVVAVVSVTLVTRTLTTPLTAIVARLGQIQQGQPELRLEGLHRDEIGLLGQSINQMLDRIRDLIAEEYHIEIQLKHAEYKALQAQVNPHFLYNTLETMVGIAQTENGAVVAELCRAMSRLFRYSLDMKNPLATLRDEFEHLKNYLYVMNVRTRNSLNVEISVPFHLLDTRVPRLSIQPLVENSINHGLKHKRGDKHIVIGGHVQDDTVLLFVEDNGVGLDAARMNLQLEETPLSVTEKNASIGIGNIHARILLLFGADFGVRLESVPGEWTKVWIAVPHGGGEP